jgi:hypothetical protein
MTLDKTVRKVRQPLMDGVAPGPELLAHFAHMVELSLLESAKATDADVDSHKWVRWLLPKAKQQGWIRLCVEQKLLPKGWLDWPHPDESAPTKLKAVKAGRKN